MNHFNLLIAQWLIVMGEKFKNHPSNFLVELLSSHSFYSLLKVFGLFQSVQFFYILSTSSSWFILFEGVYIHCQRFRGWEKGGLTWRSPDNKLVVVLPSIKLQCWGKYRETETRWKREGQQAGCGTGCEKVRREVKKKRSDCKKRT